MKLILLLFTFISNNHCYGSIIDNSLVFRNRKKLLTVGRIENEIRGGDAELSSQISVAKVAFMGTAQLLSSVGLGVIASKWNGVLDESKY